MAVPAKYCAEVDAAVTGDCSTTKVVIAAQYASGRRKSLATRNETTVMAAVRAAWLTDTGFFLATIRFCSWSSICGWSRATRQALNCVARVPVHHVGVQREQSRAGLCG